MGAPVQLHVAPLERLNPWQRDPYRLLFPLGVLLGFFGVGQWILYAAHLTHYRPIFHAMTQVQGFVGCFVCGFLLTFIPRRTGAAAPANWQLVIAVLSPVGIAIAAWEEKWAASQVFYLAQMVMLLHFALSRLLTARLSRPPDDNLIWVPLSLFTGIAASVLTGVAAARGAMWLHDIGRRLVLEGVVSGLVIGVGSFLVPVITRGQPPSRLPSLRGKAVQAALFVAFIGSFAIEGVVSVRWGLLLRAAIAAWALIHGAQLWRWPSQPGLNRRLVWAGAWCIPLGFALAGAFPVHRAALVHLVYLGGFGLLALSVGAHVVLSHANQPKLLARAPLAVVGVAVCLAAALTMRVLLELEPAHYFQWLAGAAAAFLAAGVLWLTLSWRHLIPSEAR